MKLYFILGMALLLSGCNNSFKSSTQSSSQTETVAPAGVNPPKSDSQSQAQAPARTPPAQSPPAQPPASSTPPPAPLQPCRANAASTIYVSNFNPDPLGIRDSTSAIQQTLDCAVSLGLPYIYLHPGNYLIASEAGLNLYSGQYLIGQGATLSKLIASPSVVVRSMINIQDRSGASVVGIGFVGNGRIGIAADGSSMNAYGRAISVIGIAADVDGIIIRNSSFENFGSDCWLCFQSYTQDFGMTNLIVQDNVFTSHQGNANNPTSISYLAAAMAFGGSHYAPRPTAAHPNAGLVANVVVRNNQMTIPHLKEGIVIWAGVVDASIYANVMNGVGVSGDIPDDRGAYGILVYDNAYEYRADGSYFLTGGVAPSRINIDANQLYSVHSCGVYVASADSVYITNNTITNQSDFTNVTLPKGAISLNSPRIAVATGNTIVNAAIGLGLYGKPDGGTVISTANNSISVRAGGTAVWVQNYANDVIQVSSTSIDASAPGARPYFAPIAGGTIQFNP